MKLLVIMTAAHHTYFVQAGSGGSGEMFDLSRDLEGKLLFDDFCSIPLPVYLLSSEATRVISLTSFLLDHRHSILKRFKISFSFQCGVSVFSSLFV